MSARVDPQNKMAQLLYRATGNPPSTLPNSAISNCFPGLEYDFKAFWRRAFVGIVLQEWDNYVVGYEQERYKDLLHHRLLRVEGTNLVTSVRGPRIAGGPARPLASDPPDIISMEWSNALAFVMRRQGHAVKCYFTAEIADDPQPVPGDVGKMLDVNLTVRHMFEGESLAPANDALKPGELTQGLCSPWQHDYRECSCYYWPATRPDYVNVEPTSDGVTRGDNWLSKARKLPGREYVLDDRKDGRLVTYDDLFTDWEKVLHFQVKGRDAEES
jgi:hypothetical protein